MSISYIFSPLFVPVQPVHFLSLLTAPPLSHYFPLVSSLTFFLDYLTYILLSSTNVHCDLHTLSSDLQDGITALYLASANGHVKIVELLLQLCADTNICSEVQTN